MKGYHYTTMVNFEKIREQGLLPTPISHREFLAFSKDTEGVWLYQQPQEEESLFGMLVARHIRKLGDWIMIELEVDFEIEDCVRAYNDGDTLKLTHLGAIEDWVYHEDEPIVIIRETVPFNRIQLRRAFDLKPRSFLPGGDGESP